jgi:VWFA-related protein
MTLTTKTFWPAAISLGLLGALSAQTPAPTPPPQGAVAQPTYRLQVDVIPLDVLVRDSNGRFVPDLTKEEFEIYEDGVKQDIVAMTLVHGGRVSNLLETPQVSVREGVLLPPRRVANDTSGRVFVFFVDDLHLRFQNSAAVRDLFKRISRQLVHDGDLFGIISSGPSTIRVDMTYDKRRIDDSIERIMGDALKPSEIIDRPTAQAALPEIRQRAHVAFKIMYELLTNLEKLQGRRKALVWISEGYDFNPFHQSRYGLLGHDSPFVQNVSNSMANTYINENLGPEDRNRITNVTSDSVRSEMRDETFSEVDLAAELGELTRAANRANTTIYTIDPRGLIAGQDIDEQVSPNEYREMVITQQETLRALAVDTGGIAVVNQNDFGRALSRIDAETSDYYVLGYSSNNPDPTHRRRKIEIRIRRDGVEGFTRSEYVLRPTPPPGAPKPAAPATPPR